MDETPAGFAQEPGPKGEKPAAGAWRADDATKPSKGKLQAIAFVLLLALAGTIIGVMLWISPSPEPVVAVNAVHEYGPFGPVLPFGRRDAEALVKLYGPRGQAAPDEQQQNLFVKWLSRFSDPSAPKETLVVVISGFAVLRPQGVALMVPTPDSNAFQAALPVVPLTDIFAAMSAARAKHVLLVLDIAHPLADLCNGVLHDEIAEPIDAALTTAIADGTLKVPVLVSCQPYEWSQPCYPAKSSAFALYLREGLNGAADGVLTGSQDRTVTAAELARFVRVRVDNWSNVVNGVRQVPKLYAPDGTALDFAVAAVQPFNADDRYSAYERKYPDELKRAWNERAKLRQEHPAGWSRLTTALLRAEQVWLNTDDAGRAMRELDDVLKDVTRRAADSPLVAPVDDAFKSDRLPAEPADDAARKKQEEASRKLEAVLNRYLSESLREPTKADELAAKRASQTAALAEWKAAVGKSDSEAAIAGRLIWEKAVAVPATDGRTATLTWTALRAAATAAGLEGKFAELHLLDCIGRDFELPAERPQPSDGTVPKLSFPPVAAIAELLRSEEAAAVLARLPADGFASVQKQVQQGSEARVAGMKRLLAATSDREVEAASSDFRRGADLIASAGAALLKRQSAAKTLDRLIAAILDTAAAAVQSKVLDFNIWKDAVAKAAALQSAMEAAAPGNEVEALAKAANAAEAKLMEPFSIQVPLAPRQEQKDTVRLRHLLEGAALPAAVRPAVWDAWLADQKKLHEKVRETDRAADESRQKVDDVAGATLAISHDEARRRAEASILLLNLAGRKTDKTLDAVSRLSKLSEWQAFAAALSESWRQPNETPRALRVLPFEASGFGKVVWPNTAPAARDTASQRYWMARDMVELHSLWKADGPAAALTAAITRNFRKLPLPPGESQ